MVKRRKEMDAGSGEAAPDGSPSSPVAGADLDDMRRHLHGLLVQRHDALVVGIARSVYSRLSGLQLEGATEEDRSDWLGIVSLSQLRRELGGRLSTLRRYWQDAGLPVGASYVSTPEYSDDQWLSLTRWLRGQDYDCRKADPQEPYFFLIRKL